MQKILVWLGVVLAFLVLIFHFAHIAPDFEFVLLAISVLLIGVGVAPWGPP